VDSHGANLTTNLSSVATLRKMDGHPASPSYAEASG
jgi:hypothetical protein